MRKAEYIINKTVEYSLMLILQEIELLLLNVTHHLPFKQIECLLRHIYGSEMRKVTDNHKHSIQSF